MFPRDQQSCKLATLLASISPGTLSITVSASS